MPVALVGQNKTEISFFLYADFLLFCRHKQKKCSGTIAPDTYLVFALDPLVGFQHPPDAQLYTRRLPALLSVHLNNL